MRVGRAVQLGLVWKGGLQERCGAAPRPLGDRQHRWYLLPRVQPAVPKRRVSDGLGDSTATVSTDGLTEVARTDLVSDGLGDSTATVS